MWRVWLLNPNISQTLLLQKELVSTVETSLILKCKQLLPLETPAYEVICMETDDSQNGSSTPLNKDKADEVQHSQQVSSLFIS